MSGARYKMLNYTRGALSPEDFTNLPVGYKYSFYNQLRTVYLSKKNTCKTSTKSGGIIK